MYHSVDHQQQRQLFVVLVGVMLGLGVLMVHSASITSRPTEFEQIYLSRHLTSLAVGIVAACIAAAVPARLWRQLAPWLFAGTLLLLAAVLIPGLGVRIKGAQRWFRLPGFSVQPSEIAKITLPLCLAAALAGRRLVLRTWVQGFLLPCIPVVCCVALVLMEPDLGTSIFLTLTAGMSLLTGGWPVRNFVLALLPVAAAFAGMVIHKPYQLQRLKGFVTTWTDWSTAPYQLKQSLVTLGVGGLDGVGLGRGFQKLSFLPEANTDFVFAVIGEELGLIGTLGVLLLWAGIYASGLKLMSGIPKQDFRYQAAFVLLSQVVLQALLNIAVVTAMVPPKGIAHPLLSYGGSNLVVTLVAIGLVVGLTRDESSGGANSVDHEPHSDGIPENEFITETSP